MIPDKIISVDCEANGLHGQIFAIGVSVQTRHGGERCICQARVPIVGAVDPWVQEHVLPTLDGEYGILRSSGDEDVLARLWRELYEPLRAEGYAVVVHVGWPVEHRFLWRAHWDTPFSGPFPLWDVAPMLGLAGHDPTSVDGYLQSKQIPPPAGTSHHPLHDARAAAEVFWSLTAGMPR
jgi:hypothetical protein